MMRTGLWHEVAGRFQRATGHRVEVVAAGPKHVIAPVMERGEADLLTMHACDAVINLVADGYAVDPQPWAKNDLVIVGPSDDLAGVRGLGDAVEAMRRIVRSDSPFIAHASLGAQEVLRDLLREADVLLNPATCEIPVRDLGARILEVAAERHAYTLVGRIPFLDGKMTQGDLKIMVQGDVRLRRPYVVVVANPRRWPKARYEAARDLAAFLRHPEMQGCLADFGRGQLDDQPLFFPVWIAPE
jgi:tungstate transport system substrate-binding protein